MSDLIPANYYNATVVPVDGDKVQFGFTKEGKKQLAICFEILDGECAGRRITWFGYFGDTLSNGKTPTTVTERTIRSLRYCGFRGDDLMTVNDQALDQSVSITVEHSEYQGKVSAKVAWVNARGGGGFKLSAPMKKDDLRMFAAELKMAVRRIPEAAGEKAVRGASAPSDGEDVGDAPGTGDSHVTEDPDSIPF